MSAIEAPATGDLERTVFPNGSEVFYRDSDHSYWREAKPKAGGKWSGSGRLTGVSTLCGPYEFRPDSLLRWVERLTLEGVARGFQDQRVPGDPHVLRQMLQNNGLRWEQMRDKASTRGTNVHELMLNALARGEDVPDLSDLPPEQRGYGQAVMRWWLDRDPQPFQAEQVVASLEHGFAGRLDLRCTIKNALRPGIGIVDAKTSNYLSTKGAVQVAGYDLGAVTSGFGERAEWLMVLQVKEDGTYREVYVDATHEDFLLSLRLYRRQAELSKVVRAAA